MFVLDSKGFVYGVSPVLPYRASIPYEYFYSLRQKGGPIGIWWQEVKGYAILYSPHKLHQTHPPRALLSDNPAPGTTVVDTTPAKPKPKRVCILFVFLWHPFTAKSSKRPRSVYSAIDTSSETSDSDDDWERDVTESNRGSMNPYLEFDAEVREPGVLLDSVLNLHPFPDHIGTLD